MDFIVVITDKIKDMTTNDLTLLQMCVTREIIHRIDTNLLPEEVKLIVKGDVIQAIKSVRNRTGLGLMESKNLVDRFRPDLEERI